MSDDNDNMPPPAPPADPPGDKPVADLSDLSQENANFFLYVVDFYRPAIKDLLDRVPPMEVVFLLAFLQGVIESQQELATGAFEEAREFFRTLYPSFMRGHLEAHPDETPAEGEMLIIIPTPSPNKLALTTDDFPRIIVPGSSKVN